MLNVSGSRRCHRHRTTSGSCDAVQARAGTTGDCSARLVPTQSVEAGQSDGPPICSRRHDHRSAHVVPRSSRSFAPKSSPVLDHSSVAAERPRRQRRGIASRFAPSTDRVVTPTTMLPAFDGHPVSCLQRAREWDSCGCEGTAHRGTTGGQKWRKQKERRS